MTHPIFTHDPRSTEEIEHVESVTVPLADSVRDLVDATIRTTVPDEEIRAAQREVEAITQRLRASQLPEPPGVRYNDEGRSWSWGNAAIGVRNAGAPPMATSHDADGAVRAEMTLGAAFEGPPGLVHGGVSALLLDHLMGETASRSGRTTFTGTLTLRYVRGAQLGPVSLEGRITGEEDRKVFVGATLSDSYGVSVEAHGVFISPRVE